MLHQNHQFYSLEEEEWDGKILSKSNCCNDEFWSNAQLVMRHQMNQFYSLEEEWDEKILLKFNCCNDELWSNAQLSDEAPDEPIWFPRRRMRWKKTSQI